MPAAQGGGCRTAPALYLLNMRSGKSKLAQMPWKLCSLLKFEKAVNPRTPSVSRTSHGNPRAASLPAITPPGARLLQAKNYADGKYVLMERRHDEYR